MVYIMCELKPFFVVNPLVPGHLMPVELPERVAMERLFYSIDHEIFVCEVAADAPDCFGPEVALLLEGLHVPEDSPDVAAMTQARMAKSYVENRLRQGRRIVLCDLHRDRARRLRVAVHVDGEDLCAQVSGMLERSLFG